MVVDDNQGKDGRRTKMVKLLTKTKDVSKEDYDRFVEMVKEKGIPPENIVDAMEADDCPGNIDEMTGIWYNTYVAATNKEKTQVGGPLLAYLRHIIVSQDGNSVSFDFYIKVDGQCHQILLTGKRTAEGHFQVDYSGDNSFYFTNISDKTVSVVVFNKDEAGNRTKLVEIFSRDGEVPKEDYEAFVDVVKENDIPVENIVNAMDSDDCPGNIN
ncbi:odorant-binding protein-like [Tenrec ecaudatus]|uniref:odorant-binding protein-like n=1 Tax=Tenrec ecaudatus TaxID=94439 RepID=UPI003F5A76D1